MPTASPTCTSPYVYNTTSHDCCRNYALGGISCPSCYGFNYTYMRCDNWNATPGEVPFGRAIHTAQMITGGGGAYNYATNPSGYTSCKQVFASDYPCLVGTDVAVAFTQSCIDAYGASAYFAGPCSVGGISTSCANKRCYDSSLNIIDCVVVNPSYPGSGFQFNPNPDAVWSWDIAWSKIGCFENVTCFSGNTSSSTHFCGGGAPVWLGCPSGLTSDCSGQGSYGTGNSAFQAAAITRPAFDRTDTTVSSCRYYPATGVSSPTYIQGSKAVYTTNPFGSFDLYWIGGNNTSVCPCYEAELFACPTDADNQGGGGAGPCTYNCRAATCPAGYTLNTTTNLCESASGSGISHCRDASGRFIQAQITSAGAVKVLRYSDNLTDSVEETITIETGTSSDTLSHPCISSRADGSLLLVYRKNSSILLRTSKNAGKTWTVATTIASASGVTTELSESDGMLVALLTNGATWSVRVGTLDSAGTTWTFSSAVNVVTTGNTSGSLSRRSDGVYEFSYVNSGGTASILRCKNLKSDGSGQWA